MKKILFSVFIFSLLATKLLAFPIIYGGSRGSGTIADGTAQGQMAFWDITEESWVFTETSELFWDDTSKFLGIGTSSPDRPLDILSPTTEQLRLSHTAGTAYVDFKATSAGKLYIETSGTGVRIDVSGGTGTIWQGNTGWWGTVDGFSGGLLPEVATSTNPNLVMNYADLDTGVGASAADQLSLVAGGVEGIRISEDTLVVIDLKGTMVTHGSMINAVTTVNAATYDLLISDHILNITYTSTGAVTSLTLPTAQVYSGRNLIIKDAAGNASTYNITIDTEGSEKIDGADTAVINTDYESISLYCDGSNWFIY